MLTRGFQPSVLAALAWVILQAPSTSQQPVFRSRADLVVVDVIAAGADRKAVLGLRAGDFELLVDGKPTPIETGEGGALGMALHPNFAENRFVYLAYTALRSGAPPVNRVVRFRETNNVLVERTVILDNITAADNHNGARLRFGPDGKLYVTMGDAGNPNLSQTLSSLNGKILRINDNGTTPPDNPFGSPVWTWGHRHPQGIDWNPATGEMWATEHGSTGNDEVNRIVRGQNYGWPIIQGLQTRPDMVTPVLFFNPAIAPSGLSFYTSTRMAPFRNNIFFTALRGMHIHRVVLDAGNSTVPAAQERLFEGRFGRIRDVITGPDGALYFCTSNRDGRTTPVATDDRIARIVPVQ